MISLAWKRVDAFGLERFELTNDIEGYKLRGTILLMDHGEPYEAIYDVSCDYAWVTQFVAVDLKGPKGERSLRLTSQETRWRVDNRPDDTIEGCIDVDLGWTPSTNTLPIQRLDLAIGETKGVTAAWVRFPDLTVEPLSQEYRRLDERRYRYSSAGGRFVTELEVDADDLVTTYGQIWSRA